MLYSIIKYYIYLNKLLTNIKRTIMLIQAQPTQSFAVSTVESQGHGMMNHAGGYISGVPVNTGGFYNPNAIAVGNTSGFYSPASPLEHRNIVTCSSTGTMNGSILSIPKSWSQETTEDMLVNVYRFVKSFVG